MRAVVQRVTSASVAVNEEVVGEIGRGLCVLVGTTHSDDEAAADRMAEKLWKLRVFEDDAGRTNLSVSDTGGELLVVSQFTLYADTSRGRRPSFLAAAGPDEAEVLIDRVVHSLRELGARVQTGRFRSHMVVTLTNDGPFTVMVET